MEEELKREDAKITFHLDIKTIQGQKHSWRLFKTCS